MSAPDTDRLIRAVAEEAARVVDLAVAMRDQRMAYVALRPGDLDTAIQRLAVLAEKVRLLGEHRAGAQRAAATALGLPDSAGLGAILARLDSTAAHRLRQATERATRAARDVRIEQRLGTRLLEFSQRSQESMFIDLLGLTGRDAATTYDRNARAIPPAAAAGGLVRGTL